MKERGLGSVYRPRYRDKNGKTQVSRTWWVSYYVRGKRHRESSGSSKKSIAIKLLKQRIKEVESGRLTGWDLERVTFEGMADALVADYKANKRRSLIRAQRSINHLRQIFGTDRAVDITETRITAYVAVRLDERAANASINRELACLKRMLRLVKMNPLPAIEMLEEDNVRKGFFERDQFEAVRKQLPAHLRPVVEVAHATGWRVMSEILSRQWKHVDLQSGWLRLEPGETKNRKGRNFPITKALRRALESQWQTHASFKDKGILVAWVFPGPKGRKIKSFYESWRAACRKAGLPGKLLHDFRRTAVRNLERAGVPRPDAMAMVGHKTESIYMRYAISDEASLKESAAKLDALDEITLPAFKNRP